MPASTKSRGLQTRLWSRVDRWTQQSSFGQWPAQLSTPSLKVSRLESGDLRHLLKLYIRFQMHIHNRKSLASHGWITRLSSRLGRTATQKSGKSKTSKLLSSGSAFLLFLALIYLSNGLVCLIFAVPLLSKFVLHFSLAFKVYSCNPLPPLAPLSKY
jgi:hypothetical protein